MARFNYLAFFSTLVLLVVAGCGSGSSRQVQALSVSPASVAATNGSAQFTAMGTFSKSPMSGTARVAWVQIPPAFDPPSQTIGFTTTDQPFMAQCMVSPSPAITVFAITPVDANASADISIPLGTFRDLVLTRTATQEGGFIAATAQMTCP